MNFHQFAIFIWLLKRCDNVTTVQFVAKLTPLFLSPISWCGMMSHWSKLGLHGLNVFGLVNIMLDMWNWRFYFCNKLKSGDIIAKVERLLRIAKWAKARSLLTIKINRNHNLLSPVASLFLDDAFCLWAQTLHVSIVYTTCVAGNMVSLVIWGTLGPMLVWGKMSP